MSKLIRILNGFRENERGTIAIIFALMIFVVFGIVGLVVDLGRAYNAKLDLQQASDAATLAAAKAYVEGKPISEIVDIANAVFDANKPSSSLVTIEEAGLYDAAGNKITTQDPEGAFNYRANQVVFNAVAQVVGYDTTESSARSNVNVTLSTETEVVVVIDNTNSMHFTSAQWDKLEADLKNLISRFNTGKPFWMTLMWYRDMVSIGSDRAHWLRKGKPWIQQYRDNDYSENDWFISLGSWKGCVWPRGVVDPQTYDDALGDATPEEIPFVPAKNNYKLMQHYDDLDKKRKKTKHACKDDSIFGPTRNASDLTEAFNNIGKGGTGRHDVASAWAWRLLSPKWKNKWDQVGYPNEYGEAKKIVVFVSDGRDNAYDNLYLNKNNNNQDYFGDMGSNLSSSYHLSHMDTNCTKMKDEGIEIFFIHAGDRNDKAEPYFRSCASSEDHYMQAVDADAIIESIGQSIGSGADLLTMKN